MTRTTLMTTFAGLLVAATLAAQTPPPVEKPAGPPVLSEAEKAAIDIVALIAQRDEALKDLGACTAQLVPLQAQVREGQLQQRIDALRQAIRAAHPGYDWNVEKGGLMPLAEKAAK